MIILTTVKSNVYAFNAKDVKSIFETSSYTEITFYDDANLPIRVRACAKEIVKKVEIELKEMV